MSEEETNDEAANEEAVNEETPAEETPEVEVDVELQVTEEVQEDGSVEVEAVQTCLLYTSPSPRDS